MGKPATTGKSTREKEKVRKSRPIFALFCPKIARGKKKGQTHKRLTWSFVVEHRGFEPLTSGLQSPFQPVFTELS